MEKSRFSSSAREAVAFNGFRPQNLRNRPAPEEILASAQRPLRARPHSCALNIVRASGATDVAKAIWNAEIDPAAGLKYKRM